jgi:hypothetical protein
MKFAFNAWGRTLALTGGYRTYSLGGRYAFGTFISIIGSKHE